MTQPATRKTARSPKSGKPPVEAKTPANGSARKSRSIGKAANGSAAGKVNGGAAARPKAASGRRRIAVGRSGVHGKGVFATKPIEEGTTIIEYTGEIITWPEALRRHPHDPTDPHHTFYFHLDDDHVIDGTVTGNSARWINHACDPNCEADEIDGRVFIKALRDLAPGDELFYDYRLVIDARYTAKLKKEYACHCGTAACRGTMLGPKR